MQAAGVGIHAYIVPSGDAHQSEYIAECDMRRQFISKFSGSAGTAIITLDKAALWTDGRYHLQATKELDPDCWTLMKDGLPDTPTQGDWLKDNLQPSNKVGADPFLLSHEAWKRLSKELKDRGIELVAIKKNLIDQVWEDPSAHRLGVDSPRLPRPANKLIKLNIEITGKEWTQKVDELREELKKNKAGSIILTALDEIAWLLNLRGSDIDFNPVFFAYCIVTVKDVFLFIDKEKLLPEVAKSIRAEFSQPSFDELRRLDIKRKHYVRVYPYDHIMEFISERLLPNETDDTWNHSRRDFFHTELVPKHLELKLIWVSNRSSQAIVNSIPKSQRLLKPSPVKKQKAIKNDIEIQNMKNCHIRDAAALCEYLAWLERTIDENPNGHDQLWEIQGADYLENCRKQQEHFMGLSFPSISASGPNGSIIHYHPSEATRRPIGKSEMYLIDSGAQYLDGTTDVTRTVHFGKPTEKEKLCFTNVLKGHIQLARIVFPRLVKGSALDPFARQSLWSLGLDYQHGTGHGVGMFLNVHEGPSSISPTASPDDPGIEAGQILSNEPGYYEDGSFGIRIESLVVTRKAETLFNYNNKDYLKFETITFVPIQLKMIDPLLMTDDEIEWLNEYHATCRQVVGDYLEKLGKHDVKQWLIKQTEELTLQ